MSDFIVSLCSGTLIQPVIHSCLLMSGYNFLELKEVKKQNDG